jgi:hypothetical protein
MTGPALSDLWIGDPPPSWEALGFAVHEGAVQLEGIRINLGSPGENIAAWALSGIGPTEEIDGLPTIVPSTPATEPRAEHPNGVAAVDHIVVVSPDFDRTAAALDGAGLPLRRVRDAGSFRQGFRRLGPAILELVEVHGEPPGPARFWGLTFIVEDLDALAARLGDRLKPIKAAVQPGRRIATLDRAAGLSTNVAFMDR